MPERLGIWKGSLRLPDDVKAFIKVAAAAEGCSMNTWMLRVIEAKVSSDEAVRLAVRKRRVRR